MKKVGRGKVSNTLIITFLLLLPTILYAQQEFIEVIAENASIRLKPNVNSEIVEQAPVGNIYEVSGKVGSWYQVKLIKLGMEITGYIHERLVKVVGEELYEIKEKKGGGFSIEAVGIYFQPSDENFREIYGGGTFFGGEIGITFWKGIGIWAGGHIINKKGMTTFTQEETELQIMPIYGGLKFRVPNSRVSPYFGLGVGYFKYKETTPMGTVEKGDIGYIGQVGCIFRILGPIMLDIKASYSYCKIMPANVEADLGGLQGIVGVGFDF